MNDTENLRQLAERLDKVPSLNEVFGADPQVVWMPFAKQSDKRNLFVGLFIVEEAMNRATLASICSRTITELNAANALEKADGIEIMMCVARGGTAEPVLRLNVAPRAIANAELLTAEDMGKRDPATGITCVLYRRSIP